MKGIITISLILLLSACASSPYTYHVKPTPIEKQKTLYKISQVSVELTLGHGAIDGDSTFATEKELKEQFRRYLESNLAEKGLLATDSSDSLAVSIDIKYKRKFNVGGKTLSKPEVSHSVVIRDSEKSLASFSKQRYTTKYAYFEDLAVNMEIIAFSWDEEDEPRDVELIAQLIIDDLVEVGK